MKVESTPKEKKYVKSAFRKPSAKTLLMEALHKRRSVQDVVQLDEKRYVVIKEDGTEIEKRF